MPLPADFYYTEDHEWVEELDDGTLRIGISEYAAGELGDIVFVELPDVGDSLTAGEPFGSIESVKAVSDLLAPLHGTVVARNDILDDEPELINESPFEKGWMLVLQPTDRSELDRLMDQRRYKEHLDEVA